jgi:serine/threonine protein kinase
MQKLVSLKAKLSGNKHVVPLTHFFMSSEDQYCSTFYKIYAVYEYPQRTLLTEITERKLLKKRFTETELWSILASCIVGLSHLQRNGIKHSALKSSTILLSQ